MDFVRIACLIFYYVYIFWYKDDVLPTIFSILALRIHCSFACKELLENLGGYHVEDRGLVPMKVCQQKYLCNFIKVIPTSIFVRGFM